MNAIISGNWCSFLVAQPKIESKPLYVLHGGKLIVARLHSNGVLYQGYNGEKYLGRLFPDIMTGSEVEIKPDDTFWLEIDNTSAPVVLRPSET